MYQRSTLPVTLPEVAERPGISHRRDPRAEEVGAEGQYIACVLDVEVRHHILVEDLLHGRPEVGPLQRLVGNVTTAKR